MRISDWSSDVCSSDLCCADACPKQHRHPKNNLQGADKNGKDDREWAKPFHAEDDKILLQLKTEAHGVVGLYQPGENKEKSCDNPADPDNCAHISPPVGLMRISNS